MTAESLIADDYAAIAQGLARLQRERSPKTPDGFQIPPHVVMIIEGDRWPANSETVDLWVMLADRRLRCQSPATVAS